MDKFERTLCDLPWQGPSEDLKNRIFGKQQHYGWWAFMARQRIAVGWAAGFAVTAAFLGYWLGTSGTSLHFEAPVLADTQTELYIIEAASRENSFDLDDNPLDILPGEWIINVGYDQEIEQ